jgi:hypothetical protein
MLRFLSGMPLSLCDGNRLVYGLHDSLYDPYWDKGDTLGYPLYKAHSVNLLALSKLLTISFTMALPPRNSKAYAGW